MLVTTVTAPIVEITRRTYNDYLKDGVDKVYETGRSAYKTHVAPLSEKHVAPLYEKHMAHSVELGKETVRGAWRDILPLLETAWSHCLDGLVRTTQSSCEASLDLIQDVDHRTKVQKLCQDAKPFVLTLLSLPLVLVFCRAFLWLILLPFRALLLLSPLRFGGLGIQDDVPEPVSAKNGKEKS